MFDFEKLTVYQKAKEYNKSINELNSNIELDRTTKDQSQNSFECEYVARATYLHEK